MLSERAPGGNRGWEGLGRGTPFESELSRTDKVGFCVAILGTSSPLGTTQNKERERRARRAVSLPDGYLLVAEGSAMRGFSASSFLKRVSVPTTLPFKVPGIKVSCSTLPDLPSAMVTRLVSSVRPMARS